MSGINTEIAIRKLVPSANADTLAALVRSYGDTMFFAKWMMPQAFTKPFTWQHERIYKLMDDETLPKVCVCMWRGAGKTSTAEAKIIKSAVFRQKKFIMVVAASFDKAAEITENVRMELTTNERIIRTFCPPGTKFTTKSFEDASIAQSKKGFFICDPVTGRPHTFIMPKGIDQPFRGSKINMMGTWVRPDMIFVDDLEKDDEVTNPDIRRKVRETFESKLMPCVSDDMPEVQGEFRDRWRPDYANNPQWQPPWRIFYMDTIKDPDANIVHILADPEWMSVRMPQFKLCEEGEKLPGGKIVKFKGYYSLVPERISTPQVQLLVKRAKKKGAMTTLARERMCLATPPEMNSISSKLFKYYDETEEHVQRGIDVTRVVIMDPARTQEPKSSLTAVLSVGIHAAAGKIHIRDLKAARMDAAELYRSPVDMCIKENAELLFVERQGLHMHLEHALRTEIGRRGLEGRLHLCWLKPQGLSKTAEHGNDRLAIKRARSGQILPYYQNGNVYHNNRTIRNSILEANLLQWPDCKMWDIMDCLGYIPQVMATLKIYFDSKPSDDLREFGSWADDFERAGQFFNNHENWVGAA
jgi:hypothetical protein